MEVTKTLEEEAKATGLAETTRVAMEGNAAGVTTAEMKEEAAEAAEAVEEVEEAEPAG